MTFDNDNTPETARDLGEVNFSEDFFTGNTTASGSVNGLDDLMDYFKVSFGPNVASARFYIQFEGPFNYNNYMAYLSLSIPNTEIIMTSGSGSVALSAFPTAVQTFSTDTIYDVGGGGEFIFSLGGVGVNYDEGLLGDQPFINVGYKILVETWEERSPTDGNGNGGGGSGSGVNNDTGAGVNNGSGGGVTNSNNSLNLFGTSGPDQMSGAEGDDSFKGGADDDVIFGGDGVDTAKYDGFGGDIFFTINDDGSIFVDARATGEGFDTLFGVERLEFSNGTFALDINGNAGQAYRLYQAAFDRTPDLAGLGHWIKELDAGKGDLTWMAANFIISEEFRDKYGTKQTVTDDVFIDLLYNNVLDRIPDGEGRQHWKNELINGASREDILVSFSESAENQVNVIGQIEDGIFFF